MAVVATPLPLDRAGVVPPRLPLPRQDQVLPTSPLVFASSVPKEDM
jgi:hypothetical protein